MSRVLLTGATGFVGRQIHRALCLAGHEVTVVLRPGAEGRLGMPLDEGAIVRTADLFSQGIGWWRETLTGIDTVIHAAWSVEPGKYLDSPDNLHCVSGTLALAQGALQAGVSHVIGIGTCMEYRLPSEHLDVASPLEPTTLYAACKLSTWQILRELFATQEVAFSWCRLFYLFGEGEHAARLVPTIRRQIEAGEKAQLSAGTQLRDYLDVAEAGRMIADVVETRQTGAINICSGKAITIRRFAEQIADTYGRRDLLAFGTAQIHPGDPAAVVGICNAIAKSPTA